MVNKQVKLRLLIILLPIVSLILAIQPAEAAASRWALWKLTASFPNNSLTTTLIVQVGHTTTSGKNVIDLESDFPVPCLAVGKPVIQNNQATFDGSSYFSCTIPSIQDKVSLMTSGYFTIPATCSSKRPYINAVATINSTPIQASSDNPLFYRKDNNQNVDFSLDVPLDTTTQQATMRTQFGVGQLAILSDDFNISTDQLLSAEYQRIGNTYRFAPKFTVDAISLTAIPDIINGPFVLSNLESIAYIGYSPTQGTYFEGSLTSILVDPYCTGTG